LRIAPVDPGQQIAKLGRRNRDRARLPGLATKTLQKIAATAVIPPKSNRKETIPCDFALYGWRHLVENPQNQRIPPHRNPIRQNRLQLPIDDLLSYFRDCVAVNVHGP
jgi:hypothetical protein